MTTNNDVTRHKLARALLAVLPYAETRAEDMSETADRVRDNVEAGVWDEQQAREAEQQRDKAWEAVNHAKALLGFIVEAENRVRSAPSDIGINDAWLGGITDSLRVDAGFSNPHALVRYYAVGVRNMHKRGWKPDEAAVAITEAETLTPDERIQRYMHERFPARVAQDAADTLFLVYQGHASANAWERAALSEIFAAEAL
jgi:hypothetical protein